VEDEEMNAELRARERWNDPAREFLTSSTAAGAGAGGKRGEGLYGCGTAKSVQYKAGTSVGRS